VNLILLLVYLLKILKTLFLVNFMTLLSLLSKMFFSFFVSQYFTFSILYNVLCTYLSLHAHCHCNVCIVACMANKLLHSQGHTEQYCSTPTPGRPWPLNSQIRDFSGVVQSCVLLYIAVFVILRSDCITRSLALV